MIPPGRPGPSGNGTAIVRHGMTAEGKQRDRCRECRLGRGRTFLLAYTYAGQSPEVTQQSVAMALKASGLRETARGLHVRPPPVMTERKTRHLRSNTCITQGGSACHQSAWRGRAVAPRSLTTAAGCPPHSRRGGALAARKPSRGGAGMPWIIPGGPCWRLSLGDGRMTCFSNGKSAWPLCTSPASLPMAGAPTSVIAIPRSPRWAKPRRQRATASPSMCRPGSSGSCVVRSVFPQRPRCMISCWVSSSTATHWGWLSDEESTALKHLPFENTDFNSLRPFLSLTQTVER